MQGDNRRQLRLEALNDLRHKLHRTSVAMSFLPPSELGRHLGLTELRVARMLLGNERLAHRLYWQIVDDGHAPDIAAIPVQSELKIIDSSRQFENACESVDIVMALQDHGIMIGKDEIKQLARRYGDARLRWAWDNRDLWADPSRAASSPAPSDAPPQRKKDARRLLLEHLAHARPEIASWMGRISVSEQRKASMTPARDLVGRVVDRLVNPGRTSQHV